MSKGVGIYIFIGLGLGLLLGRIISTVDEGDSVPDAKSATENPTVVKDASIPPPGQFDSAKMTAVLEEEGVWNRLTQMMSYVNALAEEVLPEAAKFAAQSLETKENKKLLNLVLSRWAEVDRAATLQFVLKLFEQDSTEMGFLLGDWAYLDPVTVMEYADSLKGQKSVKEQLYSSAMSALAEDDPYAALRIYRIRVRKDFKHNYVLSGIIKNIAGQNLADAIAEFENSSDQERQFIANGLLEHYIKTDFEGGMAFIQTLPLDLMSKYGGVYRFFRPWVVRDPQGTLDAITAMKPGKSRDHFLSNALSMWSNNNLDSALSWIESRLDLPEVQKAFQSIKYGLGRIDPERGLKFIASHPELADSREALISAWMQNDFEKAFGWVEANMSRAEMADFFYRNPYGFAPNFDKAKRILDLMPMGDSRDQFFSRVVAQIARKDIQQALNILKHYPDEHASFLSWGSVMREWASSDLPSAAAYVAALQTKNLKIHESLIASVVQEWGKHDPAEAVKWLEGFEDAKLRKAGMRGLIYHWSEKDLDSATQKVLSINDIEEKQVCLDLMVGAVARKNPEKAVTWMMSLPESEQSNTMLRTLLRGWMSRDSIAASQWVNEIPEGSKRDTAASVLVDNLTYKSPKDALPWAMEIKNENTRNNMLRRLAQSASNIDPEIALQAIEAMTKDEAYKAKLRKKFLMQ